MTLFYRFQMFYLVNSVLEDQVSSGCSDSLIFERYKYIQSQTPQCYDNSCDNSLWYGNELIQLQKALMWPSSRHNIPVE